MSAICQKKEIFPTEWLNHTSFSTLEYFILRNYLIKTQAIKFPKGNNSSKNIN